MKKKAKPVAKPSGAKASGGVRASTKVVVWTPPPKAKESKAKGSGVATQPKKPKPVVWVPPPKVEQVELPVGRWERSRDGIMYVAACRHCSLVCHALTEVQLNVWMREHEMLDDWTCEYGCAGAVVDDKPVHSYKCEYWRVHKTKTPF